MSAIQKYFFKNNESISVNNFDITEFESGIPLYEVVKIINSKALFLEEHIERLKKSAKIKNKEIWLSDSQIFEKINEIIKINNVENGRLQFVFSFNGNIKNFYAFFIELADPDPETYKKGAKIIAVEAQRYNPNAKIINYDFRSNIKLKLQEQNAYEALLVCKNGKITEGSKSNFFLIKNKKVYTAFAQSVLPGITRDYVFRICAKNNIEIIEKDIYLENLNEFDSAFITGTSIGVLPVKQINNFEFSVTNKILQTLSSDYQKCVDEYLIR